MSLRADDGAVAGAGLVTGTAKIDLAAGYGIGSIDAPLRTRTATLSTYNNYDGDIAITNYNSATPGFLKLLTAYNRASAGAVRIENHGAMTLASVDYGGERGAAAQGGVTLIANSPLAIDNDVNSAAGNIDLTAGNGPGGDNLVFKSGVTISAAGNVTLKAGNAIQNLAAANLAYGGSLVQRPDQNLPAVGAGAARAVAEEYDLERDEEVQYLMLQAGRVFRAGWDRGAPDL